MADLGQSRSAGVLGDPSIFKTFWTAIKSALRASGNIGSHLYPFDKVKQSTGPVMVTEIMLNAQYLCQIPQRKDTASIVIAVIVADLVLLQATWKVFTWFTTFWLEKKRSDAKFCVACAQNLASASSDAVEQSDTGSLTSSYEMYRSSVVKPRTAQYAKLPQVQVGEASGGSIQC